MDTEAFASDSYSFSTPRLTIGGLSSSDFPDYAQIVCLPAMGAYDEEFPKTLDQAQIAFQETLQQKPFQDNQWQEFGVFLNRQIIGILSHCTELRFTGERVTRMGYHFHPNWQGQGFATEAVEGFIRILKERQVQWVECIVDPANYPSIALLQRLGFITDGVVDHTPVGPELLYRRMP